MPKKLLYFIIFLLIAVIFFTVNRNNTCDIIFFFEPLTLHKVPVFYSLAVSFVLGMLVMLPFALFRGKKKASKTQPKQPRGKKTAPETPAGGSDPQ
ncbi:MAG: hypothetical protein LBS97_07335 [Treponema sp.]|jgi:uncharacterized integral membrane protein|nr:hypothetical protein [Treponema sp.]